MSKAVVLYAVPTIGHIVSMTELAKLIHKHNPNLSITILHGTDPNEQPTTTAVLQNLINSNPTITFHQLPPPPTTSSSISPLAAMFNSIRHNTPNVISILRQISSHSTITALIIDLFCSSILPAAQDQLGIPTYYFFTGGAAALAAFLYTPTLDKTAVDLSFKDLPDLTIEFPGLPLIPAPEMPQSLRDRDDQTYHEMVYCTSCLSKSKGVIVNTFDELEIVAMSAIREGRCSPDSPTPPIYTVGPLTSSSSSNSSNNAKHECLSWLDTQLSRSVIFLCFGSRGVFTPHQITEIAHGLEQTHKPFLWVIKTSIPGEELASLPEGFLDRTKDRGMVVRRWVPQIAVLKHRSVGGFVTHCGWNSILEAVVTGQPMVAWPLYAEQHINRAALVKNMGMAVEVNYQRKEDRFVCGEEVARCVDELMESEKGRVIREKCGIMRKRGLEACRDGGSSMLALRKLIQVWNGN